MRRMPILWTALILVVGSAPTMAQTAIELATFGEWRVTLHNDPFAARPVCNVFSTRYQWISAWRNEINLKFSEPGKRTVRFKVNGESPRAAATSRDGRMAYITELDFGRARSLAIQITPERDAAIELNLDLSGLRDADARARRAPCPVHSGL